jgi:hypothetical protein
VVDSEIAEGKSGGTANAGGKKKGTASKKVNSKLV